jgi:hypothetical protein
MESAAATGELRVSDHGLGATAGWCESLAGGLAANHAPTDAGLSMLASSAAVSAAHARVAAAGIRCASRVRGTASKLTVASIGYGENEARSAAQFRALDPVAAG